MQIMSSKHLKVQCEFVILKIAPNMYGRLTVIFHNQHILFLQLDFFSASITYFVCHCLATKVFIGKLPATRWVEVTMRYPGDEQIS